MVAKVNALRELQSATEEELSAFWADVAAVPSEECFAIHLNQMQSYIRENL